VTEHGAVVLIGFREVIHFRKHLDDAIVRLRDPVRIGEITVAEVASKVRRHDRPEAFQPFFAKDDLIIATFHPIDQLLAGLFFDQRVTGE